MARYAETRRNIMKMFETVQLDNASLTAFQRQIFSMADHFHNPNLVLSRENMAQLADLGNKVSNFNLVHIILRIDQIVLFIFRCKKSTMRFWKKFIGV